MHISFILEWWLLLPILLTLVLVAGGVWADPPALLDFEGIIIGLALSAFAWAAILYGRYEQWLVLPVLITLFCVIVSWRERKDIKREGVRITAVVGIICWALVLYGRLTA